MPDTQTYPPVPVHFEMPADQRNRFKIMRIARGHANLGELVIEMMDLVDAWVALSSVKEPADIPEAPCPGQS